MQLSCASTATQCQKRHLRDRSSLIGIRRSMMHRSIVGSSPCNTVGIIVIATGMNWLSTISKNLFLRLLIQVFLLFARIKCGKTIQLNNGQLQLQNNQENHHISQTVFVSSIGINNPFGWQLADEFVIKLQNKFACSKSLELFVRVIVPGTLRKTKFVPLRLVRGERDPRENGIQLSESVV